MKWFFRFAIFWMLPCISDGPDVTCSGPVRIVKIRTPTPCGSCASEALRPSGGEGRRVPPPPLPACLRYTNLQFLWSHAGDSTCVCVQECGESVWVWETESLHSFFFLPSQPSASALSLHLQSCCTRSRRTEVCVVFLKGRRGGVGVVRMMTRWKGPGEEETQECPFPLPPFSFSLSLALASSLSLSVTWCVCVFAVCVWEREWNRSAMLQQTGLWTCTGGSSPFQIEVCHWIVITRISRIPAPRGEICDWVKDGMLKAVETDSRGSVFSHQITHYVNVSTLKDKDVWG